ncbi:hypothetical protein EMA8858_00967 [Emticicia aquatica]|jgi:hypothetical protein|uniref:Uncharacterized protein n=1 Tax=Emticicia aquatica TaxID=1681835 RepID=A0ABN8EPM3_9BACT|nr:hypothetical protein [Emticicia aquatica]CAH0994855.1 hypothetical protein EMA8858_00967 [Emticicia aquatica]
MKTRFLILFLLIGKISFAQIPSIDLTAIQRLIELKNTVATLKKGLALQKNIDTNTMGDEANSTALVEAQGKIEDFLRDSDEYIRLSFNNTAYSDLNNLSRFSQNLKSNISNNLNSSTWKVNDLQVYLMRQTTQPIVVRNFMMPSLKVFRWIISKVRIPLMATMTI